MLLRTAAVASLLSMTPTAAANTASPNKAISKPKCNSSAKVSIRYSSGSKNLYVESGGSKRGGCVTLKEIWGELGGGAPLYAVDSSSGDVSKSATGTWLLTENLIVEDGITLQVNVVKFWYPCSSFSVLVAADSYGRSSSACVSHGPLVATNLGKQKKCGSDIVDMPQKFMMMSTTAPHRTAPHRTKASNNSTWYQLYVYIHTWYTLVVGSNVRFLRFRLTVWMPN